MTALVWVAGLVAVVAGAVAARAGFGIGSLVTPALTPEVGVKVAVALVAIPHAAATVARLWFLRRSIDRHVLLTFGLASAAGGLIGAVLHASLTSPVLGMALGALLVLAGTLELFRLGATVRVPPGWAIATGALSGLFGGLVGNQGGIRSAALLRFDLSREALVGTATATALLVDAVRLPVYVVTNGALMLREWPTITVLTAGVLAGTFLGAPILRHVPERIFRRGLAVLLVLVGLALIGASV